MRPLIPNVFNKGATQRGKVLKKIMNLKLKTKTQHLRKHMRSNFPGNIRISLSVIRWMKRNKRQNKVVISCTGLPGWSGDIQTEVVYSDWQSWNVLEGPVIPGVVQGLRAAWPSPGT